MIQAARDEDLRSLRPYLFGLAYRMLGRIHDAEDIVQDTCLAYMASGGATKEIHSLRAYLTTIAIRLCLAHRKFQASDQGGYIGPWLPEPLATEGSSDPLAELEKKDALSLAFLRLLERLSPLERAAFLLGEIFEFPYEDIALILQRSEAACRQLVHRAKEHLHQNPRYDVSLEEQETTLSAFLGACALGDPQGLLALFAKDIRVISDSGGKARSARREILGADRCSRFLIGVAKKRDPAVRIEPMQINGTLGFVLLHGDLLTGAMTFHLHQGQIQEIAFVLNPDKLAFLATQRTSLLRGTASRSLPSEANHG